MRVDRKLLETELAKLVAGLKKLGAEKIVLFGSLAKGEPRVHSDIDLIAIFDDQDHFKTRMQRVYSELSAQVNFDVLAYNWREFEKVKARSFFRRIEKEGKVLYEAER